MSENGVIPVARIENIILVIREQKVIKKRKSKGGRNLRPPVYTQIFTVASLCIYRTWSNYGGQRH